MDEENKIHLREQVIQLNSYRAEYPDGMEISILGIKAIVSEISMGMSGNIRVSLLSIHKETNEFISNQISISCFIGVISNKPENIEIIYLSKEHNIINGKPSHLSLICWKMKGIYGGEYGDTIGFLESGEITDFKIVAEIMKNQMDFIGDLITKERPSAARILTEYNKQKNT